MAESIISKYPFSPEEHAELASLEEKLDLLFFFEPGLREIELAADIERRLQTGAKNPHSMENSQKALGAKRVADFLASLSQCDTAALVRTVQAGLRSLGIERRKAGRPGGRKKEALYANFVQVVTRAIENTGVLARKAELKRTRGRKWDYDFRRYLESKGWPRDRFDFLRGSTTARALAIRIVSEHFDRPYDRVYKAVMASKPVEK